MSDDEERMNQKMYENMLEVVLSTELPLPNLEDDEVKNDD